MKNIESEASLQERCQKIFKDNGCFVFKTHGDMYTRIGIPDLVACIPVNVKTLQKLLSDGVFQDGKIGVFVSVETKKKGKLNSMDDRRRAQEIVGREIKSAGGLWRITDTSDTVVELINLLRGDSDAVQ